MSWVDDVIQLQEIGRLVMASGPFTMRKGSNATVVLAHSTGLDNVSSKLLLSTMTHTLNMPRIKI